jgi:hypothetical protein
MPPELLTEVVPEVLVELVVLEVVVMVELPFRRLSAF